MITILNFFNDYNVTKAIMQLLQNFQSRWSEPSGYRDVCRIAFPLVLSTSSWTIQNFVDRMFLTWYSPSALAASMPSSIVSFTILSFFLGIGSYTSTFVAQYFGAKRPNRIGCAVWQGIYFSALTFILFLLLVPATSFIFAMIDHDPKLQALECEYFRILCYGAGFTIYSTALSSFFSGLGRTWTIMWVNILATIFNIIFDYCLIFGYFGFPEWGIAGAAYATVFSHIFGAVIFSLLIFRNREYRQEFAVTSGWKFDKVLFSRLLRFGTPNGLQFCLDNLAFTFFIIFVGRLGENELTSTGIAFQINTIAFLPMIGFSIATSVLVGQSLGANRPDLATRATWNSFHIAFIYMASIAGLYVIFPDIFIYPFALHADPVVMEQIHSTIVTLLKFIAVYSLFDVFNIIFSGTLKGAGDTTFVMYFSLVCGWVVLVIPTYFIIHYQMGSFLTTWYFVTLYVSLVGIGFFFRFLQGKWKKMRVIESAPVCE